MHKQNHILDKYFAEEELTFVRKDGDKVTEYLKRTIVFCTDVAGLIDDIIEKRGLSADIIIRLGIDGGGGFLKIAVSVFEIDSSPNTSGVRRKLFSAGIDSTLKNTGVKRIFILALVANIPENYENIKRLWVHTGLHNLTKSFYIASDLKLSNIMLGLMSHSSLHPCTWCTANKYHLEKEGELRTFRSLDDEFWNYYDDGQLRNKAKFFCNVIHPAIVKVKPEEPVLSLFPPPELHLLTGPVKAMFDGLVAVWDGADIWLKKCQLEQEGMHGGSFTGRYFLYKSESVSFYDQHTV